ncbi:DNA fragmentation factor subunit alpha [Pantherophis guttatus]|uniref:DNAation factor subunit alpha n=1 Tax=Pantherophis guttatus TaxID=94885 RepID=A0ABM3YQJ7_PANGU|nr:DNA fragmentation factor subunit alpha [Pantherophis guttatus]
MAEGKSRLPRLKQCLIRRMGQKEQHGVAASTLQELKMKACNLLAIDLASQPVTLVLAEDGTIIDDNDYFLCLPQNTKFGVVAKNEKWTSTGEGTTWLGEEITNTNEVDSSGEKWKVLARQLKNNLSTIVLMSEEDLQALVEVPCSDLARELSENQLQTQKLQATLQETLDRREEERRSRQLLELYLQAIKKEDEATSTAQASEAEEKSEGGNDTVDMGSSRPISVERTRLNVRVVTLLKEKPAPELSLASQDLELVCKEDSEALSQALRWDKRKTEALQEACGQELSRRGQQFHSLNSLRSISKGKKKLPEPGERSSSKRRK